MHLQEEYTHEHHHRLIRGSWFFTPEHEGEPIETATMPSRRGQCPILVLVDQKFNAEKENSTPSDPKNWAGWRSNSIYRKPL
jgi:hypothetical protein